MADRSHLGSAREHEAEALVAELIEQVELQGSRADELEQQVELLRVQRDVLEAELEHATGVVAALTRQLIGVEAKLAEQPLSLAAHLRRRGR